MRAVVVAGLLLVAGTAAAQDRSLSSPETGKGITAVAVSPDGKLVAAGGENGVVVWELASGKQVGVFYNDKSRDTIDMRSENVDALAFSPDSKLLVSGAMITGFTAWNPRGANKAVAHTEQYMLHAVAFAPDGRTVASAGDRGLDLWDPAGAKVRLHVVPVEMYRVSNVAYTPDGKLLAAGATDHSIRLLDAASGKEQGKIEGWTAPALAISPDGKLLAAELKIYTLADRQAQGELPDLGTELKAEAFSPDSKWLATADANGAVRLWNVSTHKVRQLLGTHEGSAESVAFTPDGKLVVSGGMDNKVRIFETP